MDSNTKLSYIYMCNMNRQSRSYVMVGCLFGSIYRLQTSDKRLKTDKIKIMLCFYIIYNLLITKYNKRRHNRYIRN